jgi:hypothetical protein
MPLVKCPRCGETTDTDRRGLYCDGCGEKLPPGNAIEPAAPKHWDDPVKPPDRPRRPYDEDDDYRGSRRSAGGDYLDLRKREDNSEEKKQAAWQVAGVLFAIAALLLVCNLIGLFALPELMGAQGAGGPELVFMIGFIVAVSAFFFAMGVWAIYMPVPAGIVGLIAYIALNLVDLYFVLEMQQGGGGRSAYGGIILKVILVIALIRGIAAAAKAR